jgi:ROK family
MRPSRVTIAMRSPIATRSSAKNVLVIDVGGTSVKILGSGQTQHRSFQSGPTLTPERMVEGVKKLAADWTYDVVSIGYPGPVLGGQPIAEPHNLGYGWVGFDFARAFGCPVKVINDAAMQALGSYKGGKMFVSRSRNGTRQRFGRRRHRSADGNRPPTVREKHVRGLCRTRQPRASRQEKVEVLRGRRRRASHRRIATSRYGNRGRQCLQAPSSTATLSHG